MKRDKFEYLLNPKKPGSKAHIWIGFDSACRMFSTGGMRKKRQKLFDSTLGKEICLMCMNALSIKEGEENGRVRKVLENLPTQGGQG